MHSVLEILKQSSDFLAARGVENARLNAEQLIGHALGLPRMQLYMQFERPLMERELEGIRAALRRRAKHEPLQYIVGEVEFFGLTLKVDPRALIPRPETEFLVSLLTERLSATPPRRILDLGTGSGAIALALAAHWPQAQVVALDASVEALALARENAARCGLAARVHFAESDWFSALESGALAGSDFARAGFDLIVSNPPYLSADEVAESLTEVRDYEPPQALTPGDSSGLAAIQKIVAGAARYFARDAVAASAAPHSAAPTLAPEGACAAPTNGAGHLLPLLAMETGIAQQSALAQLLPAAGLARHEFINDLTGRPRYALAWRF